MKITDFACQSLDDQALDRKLLEGRVVLVVNVASQCGLTPQYKGLQALQQDYGARGFTVLGVPCNQFGGQEPGDATEIRHFCDKQFSVSFPLTAKTEVNGPGGIRSMPGWRARARPFPATSPGISRNSWSGATAR